MSQAQSKLYVSRDNTTGEERSPRQRLGSNCHLQGSMSRNIGAGAGGNVLLPRDTPEVRVVHGCRTLCASLQAVTPIEGWRVKWYADPLTLLSEPRGLAPSCLILDVDLPGIDGLELQRRLLDRPEMSVIFVTQTVDVRRAVHAMKAGAVEWLMMPVGEVELRNALQSAFDRSRNALAFNDVTRVLRERHASLSRREREVMSLVVIGKMNKLIADELGISEVTVKVHRGRVMRKMRARTLPDLVNMAARLNWNDGAGSALISWRTQ